MKKIIFIISVILLSFILPIPEYVELNNLAIIESIGINYKNDNYTIYLKELIPKKDDNGITYQYHYYKETSNSITNAYQKIKNKTKKKIYLKRVKLLITNKKLSNKIQKELNIKPTQILHTKKDILEELKSN